MLTCEAILVRHILKNMGEKQEVAKSIKIDNQSLIMSPENQNTLESYTKF